MFVSIARADRIATRLLKEVLRSSDDHLSSSQARPIVYIGPII